MEKILTKLTTAAHRQLHYYKPPVSKAFRGGQHSNKNVKVWMFVTFPRKNV